MRLKWLFPLLLFSCATQAIPVSSSPARIQRTATPSIKSGAVIYGVVPPLFGAHPFRAVTSSLDRLEKQGVDILWLTPINETNDESSISYAVTDYNRIRPDFGSEDELKELVREAHRRGMKVIFDFIANHTSSEHPWLTSARSPASATWDFYERDAEGNPQYYFDWTNLPNLNCRNPLVEIELSQALWSWVSRFDADGFRFDAAWGVQERCPKFFGKLLPELRQKKAGEIAVAEASAMNPAYFKEGFDLAYDWTAQIGTWNWTQAFDDISHIGPALKTALSGDLESMSRTVRFLNNNDTGARFLTRHGIGETRVASVLLHTVPGVPLVFTGDEVGAEYDPYADNNQINWKDRYGLSELYKKLADLRELHPAIASGDFKILNIRDDDTAFAFVRRNGPDLVWVVLNFGPAATLHIEDTGSFGGRRWVNELDGSDVTVARDGWSRVAVSMPSMSAVVLVQKGH